MHRAQCHTLLCAVPHTDAHGRAHRHKLPHCRTLPCAVPHTHCCTAAHCRTAAHYRAHCHTLPRTLPHTTARTAIHYQEHCLTLPCALRAHFCSDYHTLPLPSLALPNCRALPYKFFQFIYIHMHSYEFIGICVK
jgi:hypothetical protein